MDEKPTSITIDAAVLRQVLALDDANSALRILRAAIELVDDADAVPPDGLEGIIARALAGGVLRFAGIRRARSDAGRESGARRKATAEPASKGTPPTPTTPTTTPPITPPPPTEDEPIFAAIAAAYPPTRLGADALRAAIAESIGAGRAPTIEAVRNAIAGETQAMQNMVAEGRTQFVPMAANWYLRLVDANEAKRAAKLAAKRERENAMDEERQAIITAQRANMEDALREGNKAMYDCAVERLREIGVEP